MDKDFIKKYKTLTPPWGPCGYVVYKRTYARKLETGGTEEWWQTCERCVEGIQAIRPILTLEDQMTLYDHMFNLRGLVSGRALWQLGTPNVKRFGGDSMQSCWNINIDDPIYPFCFAFNELMLGGGVGFNLTPQMVYELPRIAHRPDIKRVDTPDCDYIVPDNREGWVNLLGKVLKSFFYSGKKLHYHTACIREKGKDIKSFGGQASGSEDLVVGIQRIVKILSGRHMDKIRPIDSLDIMNLIGQIVISGNVRRSAELAIGDINDSNYMNAKDWSSGPKPTWRALSNNSCAVDHYDQITEQFWSGYNGEGEAYGLVNLNACRNYGRIIDGLGYRPDSLVTGVNPCAEITLESGEACNLGEIFLPNIRDDHEFKEVATLLYKCCKIISTLPMIYKKTQDIVSRNRRIGISVTGFMQSDIRHQQDLFGEVYNHLEAEDEVFSKRLGVSKSIKLTTVKPSGTVSLLAGVTSGCHTDLAKFYIRRVQMAASDPLIPVCSNNGYHVEPKILQDGTKDFETMVVGFPIKSDAICADEVDAIDQLEVSKFLQAHWADNSVSCTVYYTPEELPRIKRWLAENYETVKSISFLLKSDHGFLQAPIEPINEAKYEELIKKITPITYVHDTDELELVETMECASGGCPIK